MAHHRKTVLVEVCHTESDPAEHKKAAHYKKWRETVAEMMAADRTHLKG